jgi:hypothetical protein
MFFAGDNKLTARDTRRHDGGSNGTEFILLVIQSATHHNQQAQGPLFACAASGRQTGPMPWRPGC